MPGLGIGSRVRKSPFYDASLEAGATLFTIYNHMYMPVSYGDARKEYEALTQRVSIWDVAAERQVEVSGPDATALTQRLSARDITKCKVGRARYAPMCDHEGRLINDPIVLKIAEDRYWFSIADHDVEWWAKAVAGEGGFDAEVHEPDVSPLALQGPFGPDLVADLFGESTRQIPFFGHIEAAVDGIPIVLCRSGWSHQGGFELFLTDAERGTDLWNLAVEAGEKYGIAPGGPNFQERIEANLFAFRSDHPLDADPFEVGLGDYVDLDMDHDFIGKAALLAKRDQPQQRSRIGLHIGGDSIVNIEHPCAMFLDERQVGTLRVGTNSPRFGINVGIGFVEAIAALPGTELLVNTPGGTRTATVVALPFT